MILSVAAFQTASHVALVVLMIAARVAVVNHNGSHADVDAASAVGFSNPFSPAAA